LKKREAMKLQELEDELINKEHLFRGMTFTKKKQTEYKNKKEVYELLGKRTKEINNSVSYHMPEAYNNADKVTQNKRFDVARERYKDVESEEKALILVEQEAWEKH